MKKKLFLLFFSIVIIYGGNLPASAQTYSLAISPQSFTIDGQSFSGYSTTFVQPFEVINKEWWRYVKSRTVIFNKKTHLELTVPAQGKEANEPLKFVSQLYEGKKHKQTVLRMALITDGVATDQVADLKKQAQYLMKDFKVNYFTEVVQEKILEKESDAKDISMEMDKYLLENSKIKTRMEKKPEEKNTLSQTLRSNTNKIEKLQSQLQANQKQLAQLKKELTLIK
ncbi:hypothetical protein N7E81_01205 [Reichenbachiella carrageenanivorans]|uniref:DUF4468 domain-containing protein n=1 Tax=Reichenbachiella carrageenanivorans TaxID=2979869 RepID=A0ABY6D3P5_9BACT|nr:hypothetical protein [Reichenbachiella carrageenanivorans]UXX79728.1 hypothetical protein N7E81_01205 [Reichenbachiella carrageenanivorans]